MSEYYEEYDEDDDFKHNNFSHTDFSNFVNEIFKHLENDSNIKLKNPYTPIYEFTDKLIDTYYLATLAICILGLLGALKLTILLSKASMRKNRYNLLMISLSVSYAVFLINYLLGFHLAKFVKSNIAAYNIFDRLNLMNKFLCSAFYFIGMSFRFISVYLVSVILILSVKNTLKPTSTQSSKSKIKISITLLIVILSSFLINSWIPNYSSFNQDPFHPVCECKLRENKALFKANRVLGVFYILLYTLIPFALMTKCVFVLYKRMQQENIFKAEVAFTTKDNSNDSIGGRENLITIKSESDNIIDESLNEKGNDINRINLKFIMWLSISYILLVTPLFIYCCIVFGFSFKVIQNEALKKLDEFVDYELHSEYSPLETFKLVSISLMILNQSLPFYIYYMVNKAYRKELNHSSN